MLYLNTIEMAFSKLKTLLRKRAARSFDAISDVLAEICDLFSVTECRNYFKAAGYEGDQRRRALTRIDAEMPAGPDIHLVMDNYATHKTPGIKAWLARRPHRHIRVTPTSASWINQVERWLAELTRKQLHRGVHRSTAELDADIEAFIKAHNDNPTPCRWLKSADQIRESVRRFCHKTMSRTSDSGD